jgi:spermidine synthase
MTSEQAAEQAGLYARAFGLRFYDADSHRRLFSLPRYLRQELYRH